MVAKKLRYKPTAFGLTYFYFNTYITSTAANAINPHQAGYVVTVNSLYTAIEIAT